MTIVSQFTAKFQFAMCDLCGQPVDLRTAKTDEDGKAVHDECYLLSMKGAMIPPPDNPSNGTRE